MIRSPFGPLTTALSTLAADGRILPAAGQAIVDLAAPDVFELYDKLSGDERLVEGTWEDTGSAVYVDIQPRPRTSDHMFRYFIDGSVRTYFVGTVLEHDRSSPVQVAQVGAAGLRRNDDGSLEAASIRSHYALLLDRTMLSDALWDHLVAVTGQSRLVLVNTGENDDYTRISADDQRARGSHKANWLMRDSERVIARDDLASRTDDEWLILDGSLGNEFLRWEGAPIIGVAKTFRRDHLFAFGSGPRRRVLNLFSLLADLNFGQRTAVFPRRRPGERGLMAFWYVRLRPQRGLEYPLMGVVKVEMPCDGNSPVSTELANRISGCLLAERNVTPYGSDTRWHAHIYPIFMAERVIKESFYSEDVLKAAIRWPHLGAE